MTSKIIAVNLTRGLKVKPKKVLKFLTTPLGSKVSKGHLLAEKKRFLRSKKVLSPVDGALESLNEETGELIIRVAPHVARALRGKQVVGGVEVIKGEMLKVPKAAKETGSDSDGKEATRGHGGDGGTEDLNVGAGLVPARTGVGGFGRAEGELADLGKELAVDVLDKDFSGKILLVKGLSSAEAVFKANAFGVLGIIVPRKLTDDEIKIKEKIWERVGLAFLAKEANFKKMIGKKVRLDGDRGIVETGRRES